MATKSFYRDIITNSRKAKKLLTSLTKKDSTQIGRNIVPEGSKLVSNLQVQNILRDY